ncbi:MAG: hypothetical protein WA842_12785 [Croceibacterium sp.]
MYSRRDIMAGSVVLAGATALSPVPAAARALPPLRERLDADLRAYAAFGPKNSGSAGDLDSADWIAERLASAGFMIEKQPFSVPHFEVRRADLRAGDKTVAVQPQLVVVPTGPAGITAPAVLVRNIHEARKVAKAIAVLVLPYGRHASIMSGTIKAWLDEVVKHGARAVVISTTGPTGSIIGLNTRLKPMAPVPIALMAPRDLPAIEETVAAGKPVTLVVDGTAMERNSTNVIGRRIAGPKWLAFSTPRSGWGVCAGERGPGTAAFLELCHWATVRYPNHSIFALNSGGHELDFAGTHQAMHLAPPAAQTLIWTHLGAGLATRDAVEVVRRDFMMTHTADPQRVMMVSPSLHQSAAIAFRGQAGYDDPIDTVGGAGELSSFIDLGYTKAFAGLGIHRWCHVAEDTLERVDADLLVPVVEGHRAVVEREIGMMASM